MSLALQFEGLGVPDWPPPFKYALPDLLTHYRIWEPFIVLLLSDREAWHALWDDEEHLRDAQVSYGKALHRPPGKQLRLEVA